MRKFTLKQFYQRRINRIVPALLFVITSTLVAGLVLLSPSDLLRLFTSSLFAVVGLSNIYFWREYGNYFASDTNEAPLLHTWSLGVEEQFYLVWPLMILVLTKFKQTHRLALLAVVTVMAIAFSEIAINFFSSASYYILPTRFFELMLGGILAIASVQKSQTPSHFSSLCSTIGFITIAASLYLLNKTSSYPGINALWPCLGATFVIWAGPTKTLLSKTLTSKPMVFIGLISYSLYLWHWPIISYLHYIGIEIGFIIGFIVILLSIFAAWCSWKFVEKPMRKTGINLTFVTVFFRRFAVPVTVLSALFLIVSYSKGLPQRFDPMVADLEKYLDSKPEKIRRQCHVPTAMYKTPPNTDCRLGVVKTDLDGLLIGDSFANHFTGMVDILASSSGLSIMDYTMDGCPPIQNYSTKKSASYSEKCRIRNEIIYNQIQLKRYNLIILAARWPLESEAGKQLISSVQTILEAGSNLTVILNNTSIENAHNCPIKRAMYKTHNHCIAQQQKPPHYFEEIKKRFPQVHFIEPDQIVCNNERCNPVLNGTLLYRDSSHLNDLGSRLIGKLLIQKGISLVTLDRDHPFITESN